MKKLLTLCTAALFACACAGTMKSAVKNGAIAPAFNDTLLDNNYLWVRGFGAANPNHTSDSQRRIMKNPPTPTSGLRKYCTEPIWNPMCKWWMPCP